MPCRQPRILSSKVPSSPSEMLSCPVAHRGYSLIECAFVTLGNVIVPCRQPRISSRRKYLRHPQKCHRALSPTVDIVSSKVPSSPSEMLSCPVAHRGYRLIESAFVTPGNGIVPCRPPRISSHRKYLRHPRKCHRALSPNADIVSWKVPSSPSEVLSPTAKIVSSKVPSSPSEMLSCPVANRRYRLIESAFVTLGNVIMPCRQPRISSHRKCLRHPWKCYGALSPIPDIVSSEMPSLLPEMLSCPVANRGYRLINSAFVTLGNVIVPCRQPRTSSHRKCLRIVPCRPPRISKVPSSPSEMLSCPVANRGSSHRTCLRHPRKCYRALSPTAEIVSSKVPSSLGNVIVPCRQPRISSHRKCLQHPLKCYRALSPTTDIVSLKVPSTPSEMLSCPVANHGYRLIESAFDTLGNVIVPCRQPRISSHRKHAAADTGLDGEGLGFQHPNLFEVWGGGVSSSNSMESAGLPL